MFLLANCSKVDVLAKFLCAFLSCAGKIICAFFLKSAYNELACRSAAKAETTPVRVESVVPEKNNLCVGNRRVSPLFIATILVSTLLRALLNKPISHCTRAKKL